MKLTLRGISTNRRDGQCRKPNCQNTVTSRHHRGCERMWLRHFAHRRRTKRYRDFRARYHEFHRDDCVELCAAHHTEIHQLYLTLIRNAIVRGDYKPLRRWTWEEAEDLMGRLRKRCDKWLKVETPGHRRTRR